MRFRYWESRQSKKYDARKSFFLFSCIYEFYVYNSLPLGVNLMNKIYVSLSGKNRLKLALVGDEENKSEYVGLDSFFNGFIKAIEERNSIKELSFQNDRVLKFEFVEFDSEGNAKHTSQVFYFGDSVPDEVMDRMRKIVADFESVREETKINIEAIRSQNTMNRNDLETCQNLLQKYIEAGCVIDASTGREVTRLFSTFMERGDEIVKGLTLPMPLHMIFKKWALIGGLSLSLGSLFLFVTGFISGNNVLMTFLASIYGNTFYEFGFAIFWTAIFLGSAHIKSRLSGYQEKWNSKVLNAFISNYEKKYDLFLEGEENRPKLKSGERPVEDDFMRFIMCDIEYIHSCEGDYTEELKAFKTLVMEYAEEKSRTLATGEHMDIKNYLSRLTDLELETYKKNNKKGLKRSNKELLRASFLTERLNYLGVKEELIANDDYLKFVFEQVERIAAYPYEGCEVELAELYRIAQDYVNESMESGSLVLGSPSARLLERETKLEVLISQRIEVCKRYEQLASDLETLEGAIAEVNRSKEAKGLDETDKKLDLNPTTQHIV